MGIITWGDIRRGTLAIVLVIVPTVLLASYLTIPLQTYRITGKSLWDLKKLQQVPDAVIEPLLKLRFKSYYSEYRLMNEIESSISDPAL